MNTTLLLPAPIFAQSTRTWLVQGFAFCLATTGWLVLTSLPRQAMALPTVAPPSPVVCSLTPPFFTPAEQAVIANILIGVGYLLPIGLGLGIFLYDRYASYRETLLKQQIETLERIWQESNAQH